MASDLAMPTEPPGHVAGVVAAGMKWAQALCQNLDAGARFVWETRCFKLSEKDFLHFQSKSLIKKYQSSIFLRRKMIKNVKTV